MDLDHPEDFQPTVIVVEEDEEESGGLINSDGEVEFSKSQKPYEPEDNRAHKQPREKLTEERKQDPWPCRVKKSYECLACGRAFSHNSHLRRHLVIHSGNKPYKCFICGRGFTQSGNLKTHMKVHRGQWQPLHEFQYMFMTEVKGHSNSD
ncbi:uncharacterized protein V6R79_007623 [Siganus canaliculatus]